MGHSFGGCVLTVYAQFYPNQVSKLILIDSNYYPLKREVFRITFKAYMEGSSELLTSLSAKQRQTFRYNEGLNKSNGKRLLGNVTPKSADELYKRNIVEVGADMYQSRIDPRLKYLTYIFITDVCFFNIFKSGPSTCPTLSIIALDAKHPHYPGKGLAGAMEQINPNYVCKFVRGDHYIHMHSPEIIVPLIIHFLLLKCSL
uniref:AB hydrolase-1 domain-containing protein n=2 Tax=Photinus pyralis TaxID=7054 RepID=A0A1Y1JZ90_PHOPY